MLFMPSFYCTPKPDLNHKILSLCRGLLVRWTQQKEGKHRPRVQDAPPRDTRAEGVSNPRAPSEAHRAAGKPSAAERLAFGLLNFCGLIFSVSSCFLMPETSQCSVLDESLPESGIIGMPRPAAAPQSGGPQKPVPAAARRTKPAAPASVSDRRADADRATEEAPAPQKPASDILQRTQPEAQKLPVSGVQAGEPQAALTGIFQATSNLN